MSARFLSLFGCSILALVTASIPGWTGDGKDEKTESQRGETIKEVYKKHFLIGMAGDLPGDYSEEEQRLAREHFGIVTPENCMKPGPVHPSEDIWKFEKPDAFVKWCADKNLAIHGHTLV